MKTLLRAALALAVATTALAEPPAEGAAPATPAPAHGAPPAMPAKDPASGGTLVGEVVETLVADPYTYVRVQTPSGPVWAAAPKFDVVVGDRVSFAAGLEMKDYHSKTLDRTFDRVYFAGQIDVEGKGAAAGEKPSPAKAAEAHAARTSSKQPTPIDVSGVARAEGGRTVGEVLDQRKELAGKEVRVRGKVVKATDRIMGKNWLHLQDGTKASDGANDLTVTTSCEAKVGDVVLVTGKLAVDRDLGWGYRYDALVEDAECKVE